MNKRKNNRYFYFLMLLEEVESLHYNLEKFLLAEEIPNPEGNL